MAENKDSEILSRIENIENNLKRISELNRLNSLERNQMALMIMLLGFTITLILITLDTVGYLFAMLIIIIIILIFIILLHLIAIIVNNIKRRIEVFVISSYLILLVFFILMGVTLFLVFDLYMSEYIVAFLLILTGFAISFSFDHFNIDKKITSKIYAQLPTICNEFKQKSAKIKKNKEENLVKIITIIGVLIPSLLSFLFYIIGVNQKLILSILLLPIIMVIVFYIIAIKKF